MNWIVRKTQEVPKDLKSLALNPITIQLLLQRGFFSKKQIAHFFSANYNDLKVPEKLSGTKEAVSRIKIALKKKEPVSIFGDYDADGITSTIILKEVLEIIGINASTYIPDRNTEGYGLNKKAIDFLKATYKTKLLITVDCGTSNLEEIEYAQKQEIDVIVIDHHSVAENIPRNCLIINPKLPGQDIVFYNLAGVGVVFKLCQVLWKELSNKPIDQLKWFLDLVAIGTIADCVPLLGENRIITKFGLIVLQKTKRVGLQELISTARLKIDEANPPSVDNIAYQIGPRLNAAGRMDHADLTLNLLFEKDRIRARLTALELEAKNSQRQKITQEIYNDIKKTLKEKDYKLIIRTGKNWPLGILGVVAGKICEEYHCPVFILRENKDILEGSGRSIESFDLFRSVNKIGSFLEKYGGHSQAMGIKIKKNKFLDFEKNLLRIIKKNYDINTWEKNLHIDAFLDPNEIDWDILSEIKKFEPFGEGNPEPIFLTKSLSVREIRFVGNEQKHLKLLLASKKPKNKIFEGIFFQGGNKDLELKVGDEVSVVFNLRSNKWNGNQKIELNIIDIKKN